MEIQPADEDNTIKSLYDASMEGSVPILSSLIQKDPLILSKISLTTFRETPLHISALLGHVDFTRQILAHKPKGPKLAAELDLSKRAPLHLAAAEGHDEIVQSLLHENGNVCLFRDEDGRIPLHYAAMKGRVEVMKLLIRARHESILEKIASSGETVLHLAVQHNQLEALKLLVESIGYNHEFLNMKESYGGHTILHIAVMLKQIKTVEYLLSIPVIRAGTGSNDGAVFDMAQVLHYCPTDHLKILKMQQIFLECGVGTLMKNQQTTSESGTTGATSTGNNGTAARAEGINWWTKITEQLKYKGDWLQDTHGSTMVVATVISTMTFQTAINPPGGVWQQYVTNNSTENGTETEFDCSKDDICLPGTAVLARAWADDFLKFVSYNSIAFLASLSVTLLLISGFPLKNKVGMWLLSMAMCITLTFMARTFLQGMFLVAPYNVFDPVKAIYNKSFRCWIGLLVAIGALHTVRFLIWALKKGRRRYFKRMAIRQSVPLAPA